MDEFKMPTLPLFKAEETPLNNETNEVVRQTTSTDNSIIQCPYMTPSWSAVPSDESVNYKFEVLKSGQIIEEVDELQKQAIWKIGRFADNDIVLQHPTISRYHAILQYRPQMEDNANNTATESKEPEGWYIYDLNSTHGTFLNKQRIPPKIYIRIRVGHILRLGASTRSYILQGPTQDEEPESELSVTELREQRQQQREEAAEERLRAEDDAEEPHSHDGVSWGMSEDADEETDLSYNPYATSSNEEYFAVDPKVVLRHYFEREDMLLEYKCEEMSAGSFVCRIQLPVDDDNGQQITAEVAHKGKKKDCVFQCALEACRILDRLGVLRQRQQEPSARRKKQDSDSDEDEFLDRTGDIAKRKERKANANISVTLTYEDLLKQETDLEAQLIKVTCDIATYQTNQKRLKEQQSAQSEVDLDGFMEHLSEDVSQLDKTEIKKLRLEEQRLKIEQKRLQRLIKIAKPYDLNLSTATKDISSSNTTATKSAPTKQLAMIGKRNQFTKFKVVTTSTTKEPVNKAYASDEEETEDEEKTTCQEIKENKTDKPAVEMLEKEEQRTQENKTQAECEQKIVDEAVEIPNDELKKSTTAEDEATNEEEINGRKRTRPRQRTRHKRQDIDVDELDEHESSEKYAKWVPPSNQKGDGFTALNEKYGY